MVKRHQSAPNDSEGENVFQISDHPRYRHQKPTRRGSEKTKPEHAALTGLITLRLKPNGSLEEMDKTGKIEGQRISETEILLIDATHGGYKRLLYIEDDMVSELHVGDEMVQEVADQLSSGDLQSLEGFEPRELDDDELGRLGQRFFGFADSPSRQSDA